MDLLSKVALVYFVAATVAGVAFLLLRNTKDPGQQVRNLPRRPLLIYAASLVATGTVAIYGAAARAEMRELTFDVAHDRTWGVLPIGVTWSHEDLNGYDIALVGAMTLWNDSVGCQLFAQASPDTADVKVRSFNGEPCGHQQSTTSIAETKAMPGVTWPCPNGTDEVQVNRLDELDNAYRVFAHELGHVLRLSHDEPGAGIMAPSIQPMNVVAPNRKDVAALRARYCH